MIVKDCSNNKLNHHNSEAQWITMEVGIRSKMTYNGSIHHSLRTKMPSQFLRIDLILQLDSNRTCIATRQRKCRDLEIRNCSRTILLTLSATYWDSEYIYMYTFTLSIIVV
jgi:hypothetical protein